MRVRLDRYETASRSMATRTTVLFVLGGFGAVVATFGAFLAFVMIVSPENGEDTLWARRGGVFFFVFLTLIPGVVSGIFLAVAAKQRERFRRIGEVAAIARHTSGYVTPSDVARGLGTTVQLAHRILVDAMSIGVIEDAQPPQAFIGPSPYAPTHGAPTHSAPVTGPPSPRAPASDEKVEPGSVIGGTYRIEAPLGQGGMGAVFAARHLRTGRRYAVKTILPGAQSNEAAIRRFEREATAASSLGHPGIVQVHDFNATPGGIFYLVMDLLEGETLADRLERGGPVPWPQAQKIALELASALAAAHGHGLLHRDIKPSNVFLARSNGSIERSVLVDFGLVKPLADSGLVTSMGAVVGTPMYMSPEQARGEVLDIRSDLYSLAAVIFEVVTGAPPFLDRTMAAVYARLLQEPPPRASQVAKRAIPRALDDVLARALAKDRASRFPDARSFAEALARIAEDAPATHRMVN